MYKRQPIRGSSVDDSSLDSSSEQGYEYEFLPLTRNRPRRIVYSDSEQEQPVISSLSPQWTGRRLKCSKYIDDCLSSERVYFQSVEGETVVKNKAEKTESHLKTIEYNARSRGMKINEQKTKMICISAARTYTPVSFINTSNNTEISSEGVELMRVLGFYFSNEPNVKENMRLSLIHI